MPELTHLNKQGKATMVDVGAKDETERAAVARGFVAMNGETLTAICDGTVIKGDVLAVARIAGIMSAKRTSELIPLCHPLALTNVDVGFEAVYDGERIGVEVEAAAQTIGRTGVEMEALTAVSVAALTIYDMCKAIDKAIVIGEIRLAFKSGGESGIYERDEDPRG
jgi:cyclic pyranopterin phosphate synthase